MMPEPRINPPCGPLRWSDFCITVHYDDYIITLRGQVEHDNLDMHQIRPNKDDVEIDLLIGKHKFPVDITTMRCLKSWPVAIQNIANANKEEIARDLRLGC